MEFAYEDGQTLAKVMLRPNQFKVVRRAPCPASVQEAVSASSACRSAEQEGVEHYSTGSSLHISSIVLKAITLITLIAIITVTG